MRHSAPFAPFDGQSYTQAVTTTSSSTTLTGTGIKAPNIRIHNAGPNTAFMKYTVGAGTATSSDIIVPVGPLEVLSKAINIDTLSFICPVGTATVHITCGEGV